MTLGEWKLRGDARSGYIRWMRDEKTGEESGIIGGRAFGQQNFQGADKRNGTLTESCGM